MASSVFQSNLSDAIELVLRWLSSSTNLAVFIDTDPQAFLAQHAKLTGSAQLPFHAQTPDFAWLRLQKGTELVAMIGARSLGAVGPAPLADLGEQLLFRDDPLSLPATGWKRGQGPIRTGRTAWLYRGGAWVHPDYRGDGLAALACRLLTWRMSLLLPQPQETLCFVAEPLTNYALRNTGWQEESCELLQEGFVPVAGRHLRLYGAWASVAHREHVLEAELSRLKKGDAPLGC